MAEGCIMTSAPDMDGRQFSVENVEEAYASLNAKRRLEIMGRETPLTNVWLNWQDSGVVELWIVWKENSDEPD